MNPVLQVSGLKKNYGNMTAVNGVSFQVGRGEMFALLGPNGAGKSTIVNILCTSIAPDSGEAVIDGLVLGRQNRKIRKKIGVVFQKGVLDEMLTVEENLSMRGSLYGLGRADLQSRIKRLGEMTGIDHIMGRQYGSLSGGQQRRCDIARALIHLPRLLFLDEPATGLDPGIRSALWETIDNIRKKTCMTVFLTTHYMEEAAYADRIMVMNNGSVAAVGTPEQLKQRFSKDRLILFTGDTFPLAGMLERSGVDYRKTRYGVEVTLSETLASLPILERCRGRYSGFEVVKGSMESAYLSIIGRSDTHA